MAQLLSRPIMPTAVFAEYDELAIGALWALRRAGLDVPGDVSIIGVDDHEMAPMLDLTTVAQSVAAQGEIAAQLLLQVLQDEAGGGATREPVVLPTDWCCVEPHHHPPPFDRRHAFVASARAARAHSGSCCRPRFRDVSCAPVTAPTASRPATPRRSTRGC